MSLVESSGGSGGGFAQQGSVDWVSFATGSITFPLSVLQRYASADINPLTTMVLCRISSTFRLSYDGRARLTEALGSLPGFSSIGQAFWFGFGIKSTIRELAETSEGLCAIALCGCISELHPPNASCSILLELANVYNAPENLRPSPAQWSNLLAVCSGALRPTDFALIAGQFMSYYGSEWLPDSMDRYEDVAKALHAVGRISLGHLHSIVLAGGRSCGWIAAFAYRFLGLGVDIQNAAGHIVYRSIDDEELIRIHIVYGSPSSNDVEIRGVTYFIDTITDLFTAEQDRYDSVMPGTVAWSECLVSVFGESTRRLLSPEADFGLLIHLAARIFQGLSKAEPSDVFGYLDRKRWFAFQPGQRGQGFVFSAVAWFPELVSVQNSPNAHEAFSLSLDDALIKYNRQLHRIATLCHGDATVRQPHCLATLAESIIFLTWNLSGIQIHANLHPYRYGLQFIYEFVSAAGAYDAMPDQGYIHQGKQERHHGTIESLVSMLNMASVYHTAQFVFTTDLRPQKQTAFSAACTGGLCFYLGILQGAGGPVGLERPGIDAPETATLLNVVPGHISNTAGRLYSRILDKTSYTSSGIFDLDAMTSQFIPAEEINLTYKSERPKPLAGFEGDLGADTGSPDLNLGLVVQEAPQGLLVDFVFSCALGRCHVGPYMLFREIALGSGVVCCRRLNCPPIKPPFNDIVIVDGEGDLPDLPAQKMIYVHRLTGNSLSRCVGVLSIRSIGEDDVILRQRECIPCCISAARNLRLRPSFIVL